MYIYRLHNVRKGYICALPYSQKIWRFGRSASSRRLKSANIKLFLYLHTRRRSRIVKQIGGCGLFTNSVPSITHSNHFYRVPIHQGSFSIYLLVQDNFSLMVGVQIVYYDASVRSAQTTCSIELGLNDLKRACTCGRFGAWLDRTWPSTKLKSTNIFVVAG